jgi:hypothetical protein
MAKPGPSLSPTPLQVIRPTLSLAVSPSAPAEFPEKEAFFGETHIHTPYPFDPLRPR